MGGLLPHNYWVETGRRDFDSQDPSFEQVVYAENLTNPTKEQPVMLRAKHAEDDKAPKRQRQIVPRGER